MSRVSFSPLALERRAQQRERGVALGLRHLLEAHALAPVEVLVHPLAPLGIVHGERRARALLRRQRREERLGGLAHRLGRDAGRANREEPGHDLAVGGDAAERLGQAARFEVLGPLEEARLAIGRGRAAARAPGHRRRRRQPRAPRRKQPRIFLSFGRPLYRPAAGAGILSGSQPAPRTRTGSVRSPPRPRRPRHPAARLTPGAAATASPPSVTPASVAPGKRTVPCVFGGTAAATVSFRPSIDQPERPPRKGSRAVPPRR